VFFIGLHQWKCIVFFIGLSQWKCIVFHWVIPMKMHCVFQWVIPIKMHCFFIGLSQWKCIVFFIGLSQWKCIVFFIWLSQWITQWRKNLSFPHNVAYKHHFKRTSFFTWLYSANTPTVKILSVLFPNMHFTLSKTHEIYCITSSNVQNVWHI